MRRAGFTLIEVMVAIAILAISLTAIFASEAGAIQAGSRARMTTTATFHARCKMGEVLEQVASEGLPAIDDEVRDDCCDGAEMEGFTCVTNIDRIVLPDDFGADQGGEAGDDPLAALTGGGDDPAAAIDSVLGGGVDTGGFGDLAMSLALPVIKPAIEEQVRRATVHVKWRIGNRDREQTVTRFLVAEQPPAPPEPPP